MCSPLFYEHPFVITKECLRIATVMLLNMVVSTEKG